MLSDVLFAIDNPMNMENFLCTATYRITVVYWRVSFSPPCIITFCKFTSLVQMLECGCVGVRMFDASYVLFFCSSLCGNSLSLIKMADSHLSIEAFNQRWVEWCLCIQTIYTNIVNGITLLWTWNEQRSNSMNMLWQKKVAQISRIK